MRTSDVIDLIAAAFPKARVKGAIAFAADSENKQFGSDFYVFQTITRGSENGLVNAHRQLLNRQFAVVIAMRSTNDPQGADVVDAIEQRRDQLTEAIVGKTLPSCEIGTNYLGGRLRDFKGGIALWQEEFQTQTQFRRT